MAITDDSSSTLKYMQHGDVGSTDVASSDVEDPSVTDDDSNLAGRRMVGMSYLEFKLTKQIVAAASRDQQQDFSSLLSERLSCFPWEDSYSAISGLVNNGVNRDLRHRCGGSVKKAYLAAVGIILLSNERSARNMLSASFSNNGQATNSRRPLSSMSSNMTSNAGPRVGSQGGATPVISSDDERLPLYSMALNEYCQQRGFAMVYGEGKRLSLDPPWWRISVECGGKTWFAEAKQKAKAKQKAAKLACLDFDVEV